MIRERSVIFMHSASPINNSLRSKRFRLVSEPKNRPRNRISVLTAREMKGEPKNERGRRGRGRKKTPPLPALLIASFFARSLTLVPRSLLLNRTETLATQARSAL